jgi:aldehyde:ferredoxin oxidoreductase
MRKMIEKREGNISHACMPGCTIKCSNVYRGIDGKEVVRSLEYETIVLCGSNLGIFDLDKIAVINARINDLGLDSIDTGGALGVAMDAGVIEFGNYEGVLNLLDEVEKNTPLGRLVGSGVARAGEILGVTRIPAVKGQGFPGYDPRAIKGHGVTFATSAMGADHTAGMTIREGLDSHDKKGQLEVSLKMQKLAIVYDSLGSCLFTHVAIKTKMNLLAEMLTNLYGEKWTLEDLLKISEETLIKERKYNRSRGLVDSKDKLPTIFTTEKLGSRGLVFDISKEETDSIFDELKV